MVPRVSNACKLLCLPFDPDSETSYSLLSAMFMCSMDPDEWAQCGISRDHCVDKAKKILFDFLRNVDLAKKDVDWKNDPYGTNVRMVADYLSRREDIPDDLQQKIEEIFDKS